MESIQTYSGEALYLLEFYIQSLVRFHFNLSIELPLSIPHSSTVIYALYK